MYALWQPGSCQNGGRSLDSKIYIICCIFIVKLFQLLFMPLLVASLDWQEA